MTDVLIERRDTEALREECPVGTETDWSDASISQRTRTASKPDAGRGEEASSPIAFGGSLALLTP